MRTIPSGWHQRKEEMTRSSRNPVRGRRKRFTKVLL